MKLNSKSPNRLETFKAGKVKVSATEKLQHAFDSFKLDMKLNSYKNDSLKQSKNKEISNFQTAKLNLLITSTNKKENVNLSSSNYNIESSGLKSSRSGMMLKNRNLNQKFNLFDLNHDSILQPSLKEP